MIIDDRTLVKNPYCVYCGKKQGELHDFSQKLYVRYCEFCGSKLNKEKCDKCSQKGDLK